MKRVRLVCVAILIGAGIAQDALAEGRRYEVRRTGRSTYEVRELPQLLPDDPDRFIFNLEKYAEANARKQELAARYDLNPDSVCKVASLRVRRTPKRDCRSEGDAVYTARRNLDDAKQTLEGASAVREEAPRAYDQAKASAIAAMEKLTAAKNALGRCESEARMADLSTESSRALAASECRLDVENRREARVAIADSRPLEELAEIPPEYRLPAEEARLEQEAERTRAAAVKAKKGRAKKAPR